MALKHKTITRVERHQLTVVRTTRSAANLWCEACGAMTQMITPQLAARMLETTTRAIYQQIENGELHFVETGSGELLICCSSLLVERKIKALSSGGAEYS